MAVTPRVAVAVVALSIPLWLSGCEGEDPEATTQTSSAETVAGEDSSSAPEAATDEAPGDTLASQGDSAVDTASEGDASQRPEPAEDDASSNAAAGSDMPEGASVELGSSATDTLQSEQAVPGEASRSDVDAILEETERRFEEASRKIDEAYQQAEASAPDSSGTEAAGVDASAPEPTSAVDDSGDGAASASPLADGDGQGGASSAPGNDSSEVDAILQETERRFEEASRKIDETFEEAERQVPETTPVETSGSGPTYKVDVNAEGEIEQ